MSKWIFLLLFVCDARAEFEKNLKKNFSISYIDIQVKYRGGVGMPILKRTHHSQVNKSGIFGKGWCSNFETKIYFADNTLALSDCGFGEEEQFILKKMSTFVSLKNKLRIIEFKNQIYTLYQQNEALARFNLQGYMTYERRLSGESLVLDYFENNKLKQVQADPGGLLKFSYSKNKVTINSIFFTYQYMIEKEALTRVMENQKILYKYGYGTQGIIESTDGIKKNEALANNNLEKIKNLQGEVQVVKKGKTRLQYLWLNDQVVKITENNNELGTQTVIDYIYNEDRTVKTALIDDGTLKLTLDYSYDHKKILKSAEINKNRIYLQRQPATLAIERILDQAGNQFDLVSPNKKDNNFKLLDQYELVLQTLVKCEVQN